MIHKYTDHELAEYGRREARDIMDDVNRMIDRHDEKRKNETAETYMVGRHTRFLKQMDLMLNNALKIEEAANFVVSEYRKEVHGTKKRYNEQKAHALALLKRYTEPRPLRNSLAGF